MNTTTEYEGVPMGGSPINRVAIDRFTLLHVVSGFVGTYALKWVGLLRFSFPIVLIGAIAWEHYEPMLKDWNPDVFPNPSHDSRINKFFDVVACMVGWVIAVMVIRLRSRGEDYE
tara:strand:- start:314 stop:658 length:345 start_codon:yes stop_codon:yes gene_type:complete